MHMLQYACLHRGHCSSAFGAWLPTLSQHMLNRVAVAGGNARASKAEKKEAMVVWICPAEMASGIGEGQRGARRASLAQSHRE